MAPVCNEREDNGDCVEMEERVWERSRLLACKDSRSRMVSIARCRHSRPALSPSQTSSLPLPLPDVDTSAVACRRCRRRRPSSACSRSAVASVVVAVVANSLDDAFGPCLQMRIACMCEEITIATCAVRAHAGLFVSRRHRGLRLLLHLLSTAASHAVHLRAGRHVEILEVLEVPCRTTAGAVHPVWRL